MRTKLQACVVAITLASVTVGAASIFCLRQSVRDVFPACTGRFVAAPTPNEAPGKKELTWLWASSTNDPTADFVVQREKSRGGNKEHFTLVTRRQSALPMCQDIEIDVNPREVDTDRMVVERLRSRPAYRVTFGAPSGTQSVSWFEERATSVDRRFASANVFSRMQVPALVVLVAFIALIVAALRARLAFAYVSRIARWTEATLRPDGIVESDTGATLGRLHGRLPVGPVLVDPSALAGHGAYRELPMLSGRVVAAGAHSRWREGTFRRLRDANALAILSTVTALLAVLARLFA